MQTSLKKCPIKGNSKLSKPFDMILRGHEQASGVSLLRTVGRECVWILGKREPSWNPGDPARQEGEKAGRWLQTAEEKGHSHMATDAGDGLATASRDVYTQSECYCALYSSYTV